MSNLQERREYRRIEKPYMVRFRIKRYEGLEMSSTKWDMVPVMDISPRGLAFNYTKIFRFQFTLGF